MSKKFKIAIIDYEMGNIQSIENAIEHVGEFDIVVTNIKEEIEKAECILLPGVGAFPDAMHKLQQKGLIEVLNRVVQVEKKPTLGICLGMQLLFDTSEEISLTQGFGWIPAKVIYISLLAEFRVPPMGWISLILKREKSLFDYLEKDRDFYFVHSLYAQCDSQYVLACFDYGEEITAAVQNDNVIGMQFHPEKSQKTGLLAMKNFLDWAQLYCIKELV